MRGSSSPHTILNDMYNTIQKQMTNEMHVSLSLHLAKTTHLHFKMFEDVIVSYQLHNPESFKKSKIKYFQLENLFFSQNKVHSTNDATID